VLGCMCCEFLTPRICYTAGPNEPAKPTLCGAGNARKRSSKTADQHRLPQRQWGRTVLTMFLARRANASVCAVCAACASAAHTLAMNTALQLPPMESCIHKVIGLDKCCVGIHR